jgi:hypothetical protein
VPRNVVMVGANVLSGAAQGAVAALLLLGHAELWELVALQVARGVATAFFFPASSSIVPHTVPQVELQQANALLRLSQNATTIAGSVAAGALVATIGPGWAIGFDAATYLASAAILARMRVRGPTPASRPSFVRELADGWREFASRTWLWVVVVASAVENLVWVGSIAVLGPVVAKESLGGAAAWGGVLGAVGLGLLAGGLVALSWRPARPLLVGVLLCCGDPLLVGALALPAALPALIAVGVLAGFGLEIFAVSWITTVQERIPDEMLARVSSYDALGSFVFIPVGLVLAGPAADALGVSGALWVAAGVSLATILGALASRDVRRLRSLPVTTRRTGPVPEPVVPRAR